MNSPNRYAAPQSEVRDIPAEPVPADLDKLATTDGWKLKFHLIQKAGGLRLPRFKELSFGERMKINFNVLAFLLGPFYYAAKGMWRKGLALFAACAAAVVVLSLLMDLVGHGRLSGALGYGVGAIFAVRANIDYYKKMVLKDNGWW